MITPSEFARKWSHQAVSPASVEAFSLVRLDARAIRNQNIPEESMEFLVEAGLPKSAAPFLTFDDVAMGLRRVWEVWGTPEDWAEMDRLRLNQYRVVGADSVGNPICIDEANSGSIVLLDHDDDFTSITFMNSGVPQLAEFLLIYRDMVEGTRSKSGENAYSERSIPALLKSQTVEKFRQVDSNALEEGCFWRYELDALSTEQ